MVYNNHIIRASMAEWHYYEVNDDGSIGAWIDSGGQGGSEPEFEVYAIDDHGDEELIGGGFTSINETKRAIDQHIYNQTHFTEGISI